MDKVIQYIIQFLAGDDVSKAITSRIGYTSDKYAFEKYHIIIVPSGFFGNEVYGKPGSMPVLPLQEIENIPILFGSGQIEFINESMVIHADLIASTYFLISRYEEMLKRNLRDEHGRFPGKASLPFQAGFMDRPVIDEYRLMLRKWLKNYYPELPDIKPQIKKTYLTHDIDAPFLYRSWKGVVRSILNRRGIKASFKNKFDDLTTDPYYTFPAIFGMNDQLQKTIGKKKCDVICFFKAGGNAVQDKPVYNLGHTDIRHLIQEALVRDYEIGLHASYQSGLNPAQILPEKERLERSIKKRITRNRHHYLTCREPEDLEKLEVAKLSDDFTMGYADIAGFRLGTSYPVRWINPVTRRLSSVVLHPLIMMDCTLDGSGYMAMDYDGAKEYCFKLIERIRAVGGELTILWHNSSFMPKAQNYHPELYPAILNEIANNENCNNHRSASAVH